MEFITCQLNVVGLIVIDRYVQVKHGDRIGGKNKRMFTYSKKLPRRTCPENVNELAFEIEDSGGL